ncbi:Chalcone isomerase [Macleaya cordata]|uniref:Chalcone-flavonone isomerase family protein n=1 Tax=Macleaya cordata TaxID=56857 RepID=A0A200PZI4_MACCD|nr:Chalcone isomerase [Macleaya cordata]
MASVEQQQQQQLEQHKLVSELKVEEFVFPPTVKPPGSTNTLFLGGAGVRGLQIQDKFIKFTAIGVYLGEESIPSLASNKWNSKTADELKDDLDFFMDIVTGPFEKFTRITMILPLTGNQYAEKVMENCVAYLKAKDTYTEAEAKAVEKFIEIFKDQTFPPASSILFTLSTLGNLTIGFSKDDSIPEVGNAVIENKALSEAILESIIGKNGVSPAAKHSLAVRISQLLNKGHGDKKMFRTYK